MTEERKRLQDKLRRKFKYSTNSNFGRGTILIKEDQGGVTYCVKRADETYDYYKEVCDAAIIMDHNPTLNDNRMPITITTTKYIDHGELWPEKKRFKEIGKNSFYLSLEELDLIHAIAHEMAKENNWDKQLKDLEKKDKKRR